MVFDKPDLAGMANVALRALHHEVIRQASTTPASTSAPSASSSATAASSASSSAPAQTSQASSGNGNGNGNGGGGSSSPLLFFVALGFGVVFTNLWIIVGVKYCFRYNARNRTMRMTGEDGEPINLENMPAHPRRRRREKKLMSIDEVNEKFPMMKYKSWVASRAQEGLPTQGGISQPPSRAGSLRDADGIVSLKKERDSLDETRTTGGASLTRSATHATQHDPTSEPTEKTGSTGVDDARRSSNGAAPAIAPAQARVDSPASDSDHEEDEDDRIHDALPPEALESSGDTCAICIDTLEDDDDVRGLSCGHAFHAVCLDPWLTSRRACCPLCKADYYTPKPRAPAPEGAHATEIGPTVSINQDPRTRMNMPTRPGVAWVFGRRGRMTLPMFNRNNRNNDSTQTPNSPRRSQPGGPRAATARRAGRTRTGDNPPAATESQSGGFFSNIRMPRIQLPARTPPVVPVAEVTPSNLEAGTRAEAVR
ncbi:unnamed protein product [Discula destructiva]